MSEETIVVSSPKTPLDLIQQAMNQDWDIDRLSKLVDMQKEWQKDQAKQAYAAAMAAVQAALPRVVKDRENTHTRSMYATLEAVLTTVSPTFAANGFSISFNEEECSVADSIRISATVRHVGGHSEVFTTVVPIDGVGVKGNANKTATQSKGSTIAYARRYLMLMIGNITVADSDNDGNSANATLNDEQIAYLDALVSQCNAAGDPLNKQRFMAIFGLRGDAEFADIPQARYAEAKAGLTQKLDRARKAAE